MMSVTFSTGVMHDSRVLGSARASRAVSGALAGNFVEDNDLTVLVLLFGGSMAMAARRGRRAGHAWRVRSPII